MTNEFYETDADVASADEFRRFLERKAQSEGQHGFKPTLIHPALFDFQADLIDWSVNKGRAAIMADCGLGKTLMQLVWAQNVVEHTNANVLYKASRDQDDEKHVHPLQLDVIERVVQLRSNPGETVFTPFMGVGSECYIPVILGRRAIGVELKTSYFNQAVKNMEGAETGYRYDQINTELFDDADPFAAPEFGVK